MTLLGVDVGTTGCKAVVLGEAGLPIATAYREYPLSVPRPGWAELDPDGVWEAVCATIREVTAVAPEPPRALAVATLGEAVTPIDAAGEALAPTMVSFDARSRRCHERLVATVGSERITAICGLAPQPHYSVAKWCWIAQEMPEVYRRAATLACFGELVAVRLGLPPVIDHTMAARTLAFDVAAERWSPEILEAAGIDRDKLPAPAPSGTPIGAVAPGRARDLGLADGAVLVAGALDQVCAAYAAGIGAEPDGTAMLSLGTVAVLAGVVGAGSGAAGGHQRLDRPRHVLAGVVGAGSGAADATPTVPYMVPGTRLAIAGSPAGGAVLRWYRDQFGAAEAGTTDPDIEGAFYEQITSAVADVETDMISLPHFAGSRTAFADSQATAALVGLTFATQRRHVVRALLEGVALEAAVMAERMAGTGGSVMGWRAIGGGSRSPVWMQIFADVLERPVESTASADASAVGAARIAGLATGAADAGLAGLPVVARLEPDASRSRRYRSKLERYRGLYHALAELR